MRTFFSLTERGASWFRATADRLDKVLVEVAAGLRRNPKSVSREVIDSIAAVADLSASLRQASTSESHESPPLPLREERTRRSRLIESADDGDTDAAHY